MSVSWEIYWNIFVRNLLNLRFCSDSNDEICIQSKKDQFLKQFLWLHLNPPHSFECFKTYPKVPYQDAGYVKLVYRFSCRFCHFFIPNHMTQSEAKWSVSRWPLSSECECYIHPTSPDEGHFASDWSKVKLARPFLTHSSLLKPFKKVKIFLCTSAHIQGGPECERGAV